MKFSLNFILAFFISFSVFARDIPEKPNPPRLVNDYVGGLLSDSQIASLEQKLRAYNDSTSTQIVIVIIKSTQPYEAADYAIQLGRKWGVGQSDKDNGLVLLWAPGDRKITIQTGYGMEGVIPDIYAKRIVSDILAPNFQNIQYYQGLDQAIDAIIKYASGEHQAEDSEEEFPLLGIFLIFIIFVVFAYIASKNNNRNGGGNGGRRVYDQPGAPYTTYTGWGRQSGNWGGGGFGGGFGGGSSSGGGFGGFGGGSFGGGGASGNY